MGCDGGTIPKRHELVRLKQKAEVKDKDSDRATLWTLCSLTSVPLSEPVVACQLGRLYNKDAVIEYLLDKESQLEKMAHVKNLKSISTLKLSANTVWNKKTKTGDGYHDMNIAKYNCPVSGIEMNGRYRFCYLLKCKCVLSEKVLKEIKGDCCPNCSAAYDRATDVVIINPTEEEEKVMVEKMNKRKEADKLKRKEKKLNDKKHFKIPQLPGGKSVPVKEATAASSSSQKESAKISSAVVAKKMKRLKKSEKKPEKRAIQETESYKSLFTTHSSAKRSKDATCCWAVKEIK